VFQLPALHKVGYFRDVREPMIATNKPNRALAVLHEASCMDMRVLDNMSIEYQQQRAEK